LYGVCWCEKIELFSVETTLKVNNTGPLGLMLLDFTSKENDKLFLSIYDYLFISLGWG